MGKDCPICVKYKSIMTNYILKSCTAFNGTSLSNFMPSESVKFIYTLACILLFVKPYFIFIQFILRKVSNFKFYPEEISTGFVTLINYHALENTV